MLALPVEHVDGAGFAFTTREGGVSRAPYDSLNLGSHVGDDPAAVAENRRRVAEAVGARDLVVAEQVHGTTVVEVTGPWPDVPPHADALVTRVPRLALGVLVADCTPVLLAAPGEGVVGVAHAGRKGMTDGVVPALVEAMRDLGATALLGRIGPSVCARCYEVPEALRAAVAAQVPLARSVTRHGTPSLDVAGGVLEQLAPHCWDVEQLPGCTVERDDLFSFRRDGVTGRSAGVVWLA
ncbi:MAG: hypothetical protein JWM62_1859 [Frankiales bacterium]|nr:hypothetical protein [Frankiales bacterium]